MDDLTKTIAGETEGVLTEAYKDLVRPSAKPVGTMLSYLPRTIRLWFKKWEKWIINGEESLKLTAEALNKKIEKIPEEKQCEPEAYVAIPAIQQIAYCFDSKELRNMYANLLASSMNLDKKWSVHPSFVDIIKQITPDEAKLLKALPRSSKKNVPFIDIKADLGSGKGEYTVARNITIEHLYSQCDAPDGMSNYLDNLERLKLINIPEDRHLVDDSFYKEIEASERVKKIKNTPLPEGQTYTIEKKLFYVTDFGAAFIACCIDE